MTWIFTAIGIIGIIMGSNFNQEALLFEKQANDAWVAHDWTGIDRNKISVASSKSSRDAAIVIGAGCLSYAISEMLPKDAPVKVSEAQGNELIRLSCVGWR